MVPEMAITMSFPRKRESNLTFEFEHDERRKWIPAFAGMTFVAWFCGEAV